MRQLADFVKFISESSPHTAAVATVASDQPGGWIAIGIHGGVDPVPKPLVLLPYNDEATDVGTINFLRTLLFYEQPKVVLEAGTYRGHFAISAGFACICAVVLTADPEDHGIPDLITQNQRRNVEFHNCTFAEMIERRNQLLKYGADFAFIDSGGNKFASNTRISDYQLAKTVVKAGGLIAVHDTASNWEGRNEIVAEASIVFPQARGLTLYRVP